MVNAVSVFFRVCSMRWLNEVLLGGGRIIAEDFLPLADDVFPSEFPAFGGGCPRHELERKGGEVR